ncbi:hypothetical protein FUA24_19705 [Seonamhaeicola marinus]|uniref:Uncharacterized protein n=1 Tax=Seonamhaeicola marinus TaxID=1912246 RepID=A0A5D0HL97_9FLAO|nr:hypothetical protein FUA24_19705 [Seonamhaeicola marinus]
MFVRPGRILEFLIGTLIAKNYWWSTLFWKIGAIVFFAFYFSKVLKTPVFLKIIKFYSYCFVCFSIIYILFNWTAFFNSYFPVIDMIGAVVIFLCVLFYFIELLNSEKILVFYRILNFYISSAIFIWWLIITPIVFYDNYTFYEVGVYDRDWNYIELRRLIYISANIFMYSTFTFALIFCKPEELNE